MTDEICRKLKSYGCQKYQLSLDGMKETHDWFRKSGSFDCTLEKINCIKKAGIRSVIMTTVSGTNIKEIPDIIDTVVVAKADVFAFARYCPTSEEKRYWDCSARVQGTTGYLLSEIPKIRSGGLLHLFQQKKTTFGRFMNTKKEFSKFRRTYKTV